MTDDRPKRIDLTTCHDRGTTIHVTRGDGGRPMMTTPYSPANASTISNVLRHYADWLDAQPVEVMADHAIVLNAFLDDLCRNDAFGTEGQQDPRGDHRP